MTKFTDLGLAAPILKALDREGYTTPTPIQVQAIPSVLDGDDLLGIAQTGTGKTAAFALPMLHRLAADKRRPPRKGCRALVLSPTRELATQIADSFKTYGRHLDLSVATVFGGVGYRPQIQALARGVGVLVATPGRLLDHIASGHAELSGTEIFVLDEADQMLDLGFLKPIKQIASGLATRRQTLFFSATMPKEITSLANAFLRDPVRVSVAPTATTVERVTQRVIHVDKQKKIALLGDVLSVDGMHRALVFTRTKRGADRVAKHLAAMDFKVAAIHGNKSQSQREKALDAFKKSKIQILVATDIAARGIDVDHVSHVVNYDLPEVPEAYVHRIGRTARAGASGEAISFCAGEDKHLLRSIERLTRRKIESENRLNDETLAIASDGQKERRGRSEKPQGRRGSGNGVRRSSRPADRKRGGRGARTVDERAAPGVSQAGRYDPATAGLATPPSKPRKPGRKLAASAGAGTRNDKRPARDTASALAEVKFLAESVQRNAASENTGGAGRKKRRNPAPSGASRPGKPGKGGASRSARKRNRTRSARPLAAV